MDIMMVCEIHLKPSKQTNLSNYNMSRQDRQNVEERRTSSIHKKRTKIQRPTTSKRGKGGGHHKCSLR